MDTEILRKLETRLGPLHARQRLGIETDHEAQVFGQGLTFFHLENWYSAPAVRKPLASSNPSRRNPEHPRRRDGINSLSLPPCDFVSEAMDVPMMDPTERYRELIAYLQSHRPGLGEPQMVGVGRAPPAN